MKTGTAYTAVSMATRMFTVLLFSIYTAVAIATEASLDMDDAIQYIAALSVNAEAIVSSFDKHFDSLKIPRREPKDVLRNTRS